MNGVLLGIILCAIFLTGIFTASSADTTADAAISTNTVIEL